MSKENFVKFYSEYLPQNPELKKEIDSITNEDQFAAAVLKAGPKAGFDFSEDEVRDVMKASEQRVLAANAELSDAQLDGVAGGALTSFSTVQISSFESTQNILNRDQLEGAAATTVMCCW